MPGHGPRTSSATTPAEEPPRRFDPLDPGFPEDPYAHYRHFRRHDPVHHGAAPLPRLSDCLYLFRYRDARHVLEDGDFGRGRGRKGYAAGPPRSGQTRHLAAVVRRMLLFTDPPDHTRLRALMTHALDPGTLRLAAADVPELVDGLLDDLGEGGRADLIRDFAVPLPVLVMAGLLGIPGEDLPRFKDWSSDIVAFADVREEEGVPPAAARATRELTDYLRSIIARRRREPADDLISRMIATRVDGEAFTRGELLANCVLLICAGHETTVNLLGNGLHALLRHPGQVDAARMGAELDGKAVDELLRYESPVQMTFRVARRDTEVGGVHVGKDETVGAVVGAANRDPDVFPDPDRLDVRRSGRPHLAFGGGVHHCLGSGLARVEGRVGIGRLLRRFPGISLPDGWEAEWAENVLFRGLRSLPVHLG